VTKLEVFRQAVTELGEASASELSSYIEVKFGVVIPPAHVPLFRATLKFRGESAPVRPGEQGGE